LPILDVPVTRAVEERVGRSRYHNGQTCKAPEQKRLPTNTARRWYQLKFEFVTAL
jgi:hypothetical protein